MAHAPASKKSPVIAVLNMKGGVGKTTISAHVFRVYFEVMKAGTLLIDLDPQFNLTQALFTRDDYDKLIKKGMTIASVMEDPPAASLFTIKSASTPPPPVEKVSDSLWSFKKLRPQRSLSVVPGNFSLVKYSLMDTSPKLANVRKRFLQFVASAQEKFQIIVIDCNPSSSFLTLCALRACTHVLVPVRPDKYSILGLELLADFIENIPDINPKPKILALLNGVPRSNYDPSVENELRGHPVFGAKTLTNRVYNSKILVAHPDYTGFATDKGVSHTKKLLAQLKAVAIEISSRL